MSWPACKNFLIVRLDNMGDLLMSGPAIRSLKETFQCKITLLTSSMARPIAACLNIIDDVIVYDVPWVKLKNAPHDTTLELVEFLKGKNFDASVIFTVCTQNPLPAALITYLAKIPLRLGYCRENPYELLTSWVPDREPYSFIRHQVRRDLELVKSIGAIVRDENLFISLSETAWGTARIKLLKMGFKPEKPWVIFHPGVSEEKRKYPTSKWIEVAKKIVDDLNYQVIITGSPDEHNLAESIRGKCGKQVYSAAGLFSLEEFIAAVQHASLVVSVNTSTIHIAAATKTKVVVLYAMTNPQHTPWKVPGRILPFKVEGPLQSKNEVLLYISKNYFPEEAAFPSPHDVFDAVSETLREKSHVPLPEVFNFMEPEKRSDYFMAPNFHATR
jgi:lipopolysaccharide heptosyltransferase II